MLGKAISYTLRLVNIKGDKSAALAAVIILLFFCFIIYNDNRNSKIDRLENEAAIYVSSNKHLTELVEIKDRKENIETDIVIKRETREESLREELNIALQALRDDIRRLEVTPDEDNSHYDDSVSELIIDRMWDHYCGGVPAVYSCTQ